MLAHVATAAVFLASASAWAWNGPICQPDVDQEIVLTLRTSAGEDPGNLLINFRDNDSEIDRFEVKPSARVPDAHEIRLHHSAGNNGIVGVSLMSPASSAGSVSTYEFEFRQDRDCNGAEIETIFNASL